MVESWKLVTNTLVNFRNFFSSIILSPHPLSAKENIYSENAVREECGISFCLGDTDKNLGESFCLGAWVKMNRFIIWLTNVFASNLNTINLKFFRNQGGICRFWKKFKKDSGEINPFEVIRNKLWRTRVVIDSMFAYHFVDPDLRVRIIFRKEGTAENGGIDF